MKKLQKTKFMRNSEILSKTYLAIFRKENS